MERRSFPMGSDRCFLAGTLGHRRAVAHAARFPLIDEAFLVVVAAIVRREMARWRKLALGLISL